MTGDLHAGSVVHPTAIIEDGVVMGEGCVIHPYVVLRAGTVLGARVVVHSFSVIGGEPQDTSFDPAIVSEARIGDGTVIREHCTVNRGTKTGSATVIGTKCFLMATAHVGHDCQVGNNVIVGHGAMLGGFTEVGDHCFLGGSTGLHQFSRVGQGVMLAGGALVTLNIPPYVMAADRNDIVGLNLVGLKRRGVSRESIRELKEVFRAVFFTPGNIRSVAAGIKESGTFKTEEANRFLDFYSTGKRGFARARRRGPASNEEET
jgi:UDP-N-acetylglucosamine acyltransferase